MIWKRPRDVSIDLRRPREESGGFGKRTRWVFLVAIVGLGAVAGAAVVLQVLASLRPSVFSIKRTSTQSVLHWKVLSVREPSKVQVDDVILSINGWPVESLYSAGEERRAFLGSLAGTRALSLHVRRQPRPGLEAWEFRFLGWGRSGWRVRGAPVQELTVELGLMPIPWREAIPALAFRLAILFVLLEALLALRSKSSEAALPRFAGLCLLFALPGLLLFVVSWLSVTAPGLAIILPGLSILTFPTPSIGFLALLLAAAYSLYFLNSFLRLLHVFPSYEPRLASRFPVPRLIPAIVLIAPLVAFAAFGIYGFLLLVLVPAAMLYTIVKMIRLAKAQSLLERDLEDSRKARMALLGIRFGFLMLALALVLTLMPRGYSTAIPWTVTLDNWLTLIRNLLIPIGLIAPFIGFFIAIVGRGLWDVDLIVKRTTIYSVLTGLFVIAYLSLEVAVENLLPARLFGIGWIDDLSVAALATGLVALSHRWVTGSLTRRFFPETVNFDQAIEEISEEIATSGSEVTSGAFLGERLTAVLGANPCAVLVRLQKNLFRNVWSAGEIASTALVAGAASPALEQHPSAIVMTDEGPILAARIGTGESYGGLLLLGPRPGGQFYTTEERRLLRPLLNQAALLLKSSG